MNSEQLQEWLSDLNARCKRDEKAIQDLDHSRTVLSQESHKTHLLIAYMACNYADIDLTQPVVAHLLACYYRGGVLRYFALQFVPSFIHVYLLALAKRQKRSVSMLETFFIAVYNEEVLAGGTGSASASKKVEEIRIPSVRYPSVYHDPKKLTSTADMLPPKPGSPAFVQMTVRIGPYDSVDRLTPENRQTVLTRLLKSVNSCLYKLAQDVICRSLCLSTLALCQSGFSFPESDFRSRFFGMEASSELLDDYSKKPRIRLSSQYLLEALSGVYFALFNGAADLAVRAIDAVHQRATYELYADVILVTNSVRNSLLENVHMKSDESITIKRPNFGYAGEGKRKRSEMVTNASLRVKKMPEDISVQVEADDSTHRKESSFADGVEGLRKKIAMKIDQRKTSGAFGHHRKRTVPPAGDESDIELDPISEEARQTDAVIERLAETSTERDSPEQGGSSSIRSGKRIMETSLGKEAFENTGKGSHSGKRFAETGVGNGLPESSSSRNGKPGCEPHVVANNNVSPFVGGVNFVGSVSTKHNIRHMDSLGDSADNNSL
ncbi:Hyccin [Toxocara canis]|uniref:Hyccin n=1 Tax=Toxocara canis TaxID=6265 RepID=A0A0B2VW29_TOXCA|nr:Hyccin [Toxocara canis]